MNPALAFHGVSGSVAAGAVLLLIFLGIQLARYRRRGKTKRRDGSEPEREQAGP